MERTLKLIMEGELSNTTPAKVIHISHNDILVKMNKDSLYWPGSVMPDVY